MPKLDGNEVSLTKFKSYVLYDFVTAVKIHDNGLTEFTLANKTDGKVQLAGNLEGFLTAMMEKNIDVSRTLDQVWNPEIVGIV
jgi:hypothetical protein